MPFMKVDSIEVQVYILIELMCKDVFICLCAFNFADYGSYYTREIIGVFLYLFTGKLCKCRSPPFISLIKKIQIDRRKERWQNALKEENIRIILIH